MAIVEQILSLWGSCSLERVIGLKFLIFSSLKNDTQGTPEAMVLD